MKDKKENFLSKKDFVYWILFLVMIIIILLVWKWDNEQQLANQISLTGSISSILLALIAIGYAFFQTQKNSEENSNMLNTLTKINDEISKLENVNTSLNRISNELTTIQKDSSEFQEKIKLDINSLRTSLEDKTWIDDLNLDGNFADPSKVKQKLKFEYENHIKEQFDSAFRIDNKIMANVITHIAQLELGQKIDEDKIIEMCKQDNIEVSSYDVFKELENLSKRGVIQFCVDKQDKYNNVFAIKSSEIQPLKLDKN